MHLIMILTVLGIAWGLRSQISISQSLYQLQNWQSRWQRALFLFLFSPLLIVMTAIAMLWMGTKGQMLGLPTGWYSYLLALSFLGYGVILSSKLLLDGWRSLRKISVYPQTEIAYPTKLYTVHVMATPIMFAAQVGFWQPEMVVSQGLLETLDAEHLEAVLTHEQAHTYYRDTFWFFGLGCVRQITAWLPHTEELWEELLLLRELRADRWAAKQVNPLLLAESLLWSVTSMTTGSETFSAAFSRFTTRDRFEERIEALLAEPDDLPQHNFGSLSWLALTLLPLTSVLLHS